MNLNFFPRRRRLVFDLSLLVLYKISKAATTSFGAEMVKDSPKWLIKL